MLRLLVTGSRDYPDGERVEAVLSRFREYRVTLVHGACPTGADALCEALARTYGWVIDDHPALWRKYGKAAGYRRNIEMVKSGADLCLAFPIWCHCDKHPNKHYSHGTAHTINEAVKAKIPTRVILPKS